MRDIEDSSGCFEWRVVDAELGGDHMRNYGILWSSMASQLEHLVRFQLERIVR